MVNLDETDLEILRLLVADARRPYSDIAEHVGLSPPSVSDRIDRLREHGVIERFTVDLDRSMLRAGVPVLVTLEVAFDALEAARANLADASGVEHVFTTADDRLVFQASVEQGRVRSLLDDHLDSDEIVDYDVVLLTDVDWTPQVEGVEFALECDECSNTVTSEGTSARIDGDLYHFCCPSCRANFEDRYETFSEAA